MCVLGHTWRGHRKYRKSPLTPVLENMLAVRLWLRTGWPAYPVEDSSTGLGVDPRENSSIVTRGNRGQLCPPPNGQTHTLSLSGPVTSE